MEREKRSLIHRIGVGAGLIALVLTATYIAWDFIPVFVLAVFLYYAIRPIYRSLLKFGLPRRSRAALSIFFFGLPFVLLSGYALTVIILEVQSFLDTYDSQEAIINDLLLNNDIEGLDQEELHSILVEFQNETDLMEGVLSVTSVVSTLSSAFVQLLVMLVLVYSMLIDGPRLKNWIIDTLDQDDVLDEFTRMADRELSATLFGNIVNVFATGIIAIVLFTGYNLYAPGPVQIPFPGLLGALAGFGSLIPVFGIKLVYIPLTGYLLGTAFLTQQTEFIGPIVLLFVLSMVIVDFIPDTFIRAFVSGDATHTGVLIVAYIIGPSVLGLYGLFLAPILLVLLICAGHVLLPYVLYGEAPTTTQTTFNAYEDRSEDEAVPSRSDPVTHEKTFDQIIDRAIRHWEQITTLITRFR